MGSKGISHVVHHTHFMKLVVGNWNLSAHRLCSILVYIGLIQGSARMFVLLPSLFVANPTPQPETKCMGTDFFAHTAVVGGLWSNLCSLNTWLSPLGCSACPSVLAKASGCLPCFFCGWMELVALSSASPRRFTNVEWGSIRNYPTSPDRLSVKSNARLVILPSKNWNFYGWDRIGMEY